MDKIKDIIVEENVSLKKYNTYRLDAKAKYLIRVLSIPALIQLLQYLKKENIPYFFLGAGSNVILDEFFLGAVIQLEGLNYVTIEGNKVQVGAGTMMGRLSSETVKQSLTGLEWAINIPGTVGGSIVNNAGAYNSEMFDYLVNVKVLTPDLEVKEMPKDAFSYQYRHTNIKELGFIVLEGTFLLENGDKEASKKLIQDRSKRRQESQPLDMPSAGSVFRNPEGDYAGRLIEAVGLKGKTIGGAQVSLKHANFIVNTGNATSKDIKNLIKLVKDEVKEKFQVDLVLEQEIVDWK